MQKWSTEDSSIKVRGIHFNSLMVRVTEQNMECDIDFGFEYDGKRVEDHMGFWLEAIPTIKVTAPGYGPANIDIFERRMALYTRVLGIARKMETWKEKSRDFIASHAEDKARRDLNLIQDIVKKDSKSLRVGAYRISKDTKLADIPNQEYPIRVGEKHFTAKIENAVLTFTRVL